MKKKINTRTKARQFLVQAIYQWLMTGQSAADIDDQFINDHPMKKTDTPYFQELLSGTISHQHSLIDLMKDHLSRPFEQIDPVEQAILLLSCYELQYRPDIPYRVVINEAIELSKTFGAEDGHKFINGILDKVALNIRSDEIKSQK